jgi:hypothetical protein
MNRLKICTTALIACLALPLATPVAAEATVGVGLSFAFGAGKKAEAGIGLRLFSNNKQDKFVGSVGADYMFQSQRLRPTIGAAYLRKNAYIGLDLGYDMSAGGVDFGLGVGGVKTKKPAAVTPPPPPAPET